MKLNQLAQQRQLRRYHEQLVTPLTRRSLLRGLGGTIALLTGPLLSRTQSFAQSEQIKRFIMAHSGCGIVRNTWFPDGGETDFSASECLSPLIEVARDKLIIFKGLDHHTAQESTGSEHHKGAATV